MIEPERSLTEISAFLASHHEWLVQNNSGAAFALDKSEIEIEISRGRLFFGFLNEKGFQTWRISDYEFQNGKLKFDLTRNFGKDSESIFLIPRVSAGELSRAVELARAEKANRIAAIVKESDPQIKLVRVGLNKENGRVAQMIFEDRRKIQIAAIADVSDALTPEILISTAILQLVRLQKRKKHPIDLIRIIAEKKQARKLQKLHALLRDEWKRGIRIFEIAFPDGERRAGDLKPLPDLETRQLWRGKTREIKGFAEPSPSRAALNIARLCPEKIDVIFTRGGESLRFHGLPFARVRLVAGAEKVWFGIEKEKCLLAKENEADFFKLVEELVKYRRFDSINKRHEFYRAAPEAWLESELRRNIKLLDANLVLSPVYHQFRAEGDQIDLLALRRDGRLVIIELKVAPDREMIFQTIDYWRKIEFQRRAGNLRKARLFGDLEIADRPTVCYLVAPTLAFHRDFRFLAQTVSGEIELHRFNLAENWRENLKVLSRESIDGDPRG